MGHYFDERVTFAVNALWVHVVSKENGLAAKKKLEEAVADGDADACFFLGRCYLGPQFVNPLFGFEEDEARGKEYFQMSLERGSAIGMFATRRLAGFKPRTGSFVNPPYTSVKEIWDAVEDLANHGDLFCKYMLANAYYYGDVVELLKIPLSSQADVRSLMEKAIELYEECIQGGMGIAIGNLIQIITSGDYGIPVQKERANQLRQIGADLKIGRYELQVAEACEKTDPAKAEEYFARAAEHGEVQGYYKLGRLYTFEGTKPRDLSLAKHYFEQALKLNPQAIGAMNRLGEIYFYGGEGVAPDYAKAAAYFMQTITSVDWCSDMLGTCYLKGWGVEKNYVKAKELFSIYPGECLSAIGLGEIYAYGLGVPVDVKKAMTYWDKFPQHPRVLENKSKFKKTLFGWKQI